MPQPIDSFADVRRFYTHVLGCRLIESEREGQLTMTLHGQCLALERPGVSAPEQAHGVLMLHEPEQGIVLDIDAWCDVEERLRKAGVSVSISVPRPMGMGPGQQCLMQVSDPLGTVITLRGFAISETTMAA